MKTETVGFNFFDAAHNFATSGTFGFATTVVITVLVCAYAAKILADM